jgi:hypothetical protein
MNENASEAEPNVKSRQTTSQSGSKMSAPIKSAHEHGEKCRLYQRYRSIADIDHSVTNVRSGAESGRRHYAVVRMT